MSEYGAGFSDAYVLLGNLQRGKHSVEEERNQLKARLEKCEYVSDLHVAAKVALKAAISSLPEPMRKELIPALRTQYQSLFVTELLKLRWPQEKAQIWAKRELDELIAACVGGPNTPAPNSPRYRR